MFRTVRDYYKLSISGAFSRAAYRRRYLKSQKSSRFALLHYVLFGEKRGYLPNPFFDPAYFAAQSGTRRFADYLYDPRLWQFSPSPVFDGSWYAAEYGRYIPAGKNPLLHFWETGFGRAFRPSPQFDMRFFFEAISRDQPDKKEFAFEFFSSNSRDVPLNATQLEERQAAFYANIKLDVLKLAKTRKKTFLAFIQAGKDFTPKFARAACNFDVLVNYYDESTSIPSGADYVFRQRGTKTTAVRKILEEHEDVLLRYDAVLLLDDDIDISEDQINRLFDLQQATALDLLQASLTADSECYFSDIKQPKAGMGLRPLSAVEIMMPVVSQRALRRCGWVFSEGISGWGVDLLLSAKVKESFGNTVALVGDIVCTHKRPVSTSTGAFYTFLKSQGINATHEAGRIAMKFAIRDKVDSIRIDEAPLEITGPLQQEHYLSAYSKTVE